MKLPKGVKIYIKGKVFVGEIPDKIAKEHNIQVPKKPVEPIINITPIDEKDK